MVNASSSSGQLIAQGDYIPKIDKYMVDAPLRITNLNSFVLRSLQLKKRITVVFFFIVCKITELRDRMDKG